MERLNRKKGSAAWTLNCMDSELHFHADLLSSSPLTSFPQAAQWQHSPLGPLPASLRAAQRAAPFSRSRGPPSKSLQGAAFIVILLCFSTEPFFYEFLKLPRQLPLFPLFPYALSASPTLARCKALV